ncbi:hypothetical protein C8R46DRAFT_1321565, partial [Mycena filopes]
LFRACIKLRRTTLPPTAQAIHSSHAHPITTRIPDVHPTRTLHDSRSMLLHHTRAPATHHRAPRPPRDGLHRQCIRVAAAGVGVPRRLAARTGPNNEFGGADGHHRVLPPHIRHARALLAACPAGGISSLALWLRRGRGDSVSLGKTAGEIVRCLSDLSMK